MKEWNEGPNSKGADAQIHHEKIPSSLSKACTYMSSPLYLKIDMQAS